MFSREKPGDTCYPVCASRMFRSYATKKAFLPLSLFPSSLFIFPSFMSFTFYIFPFFSSFFTIFLPVYLFLFFIPLCLSLFSFPFCLYFSSFPLPSSCILFSPIFLYLFLSIISFLPSVSLSFFTSFSYTLFPLPFVTGVIISLSLYLF
jgi:hypothetical protein